MLSNYDRSAQALAHKLSQDGITNHLVLNAIAATPRHVFVDDVLKHQAYQNTALPIGLGQTISQPYIVAKMTQLLLDAGVKDKVLEIGTGSGYQSAILAQLFKEVYSVERIKSLQWQAKRRLQQLDFYNVMMKHADGWQGWPAKGPFNGIIVTAAAARVPEALLTQLANEGVLIAPIGEKEQQLIIVQRQGDNFVHHQLESVRFVPLIDGDIE
ncbi:protein-L-isoaspartate(D-aspartate) O-methyltransferase [Pseudoalteromonas tunicata]|uniref:Protein-L-isoaspartate O-methyltransferase n=1 Tax=Pseudoalteromonas tunicata D2 TaxID=87626 RepID=A4C6Z3_9GAMM|nr:protein-L-isoaspartate(D-aspartate) O-methyltransferase [Pseudoalteromonas tunicata]ATC95717.1 protein-L-isoaspartate(D-aspartate) O-methyltransferase [Pseudoalteromonas tunicata]AXT31273.1 protein-L-isoaspartate(D-aspartate) O-methyltransferase [Pseudoalteromonas tunicata]EAR29747.1 L-isoaspartate protein carboxylmethyltransferase type II [Pseudoalteromonas tunicata D2]MDP4985653.1 protein-L-isoaspartate(D-aspartate) O-methyltransferase [Pseudoalteromonas tunicata]MDP5213984.1 protein-L-is